jgi:imidazoleglycerol-phosphate dehydratase
MGREATIDRCTKETDIHLKLNLDGRGASRLDTGIPFMDHMLNFISSHGFMDLELSASGDTGVDYHHTVEDIGICMGLALRDAVGDKGGIRRYGEATVPMDEALARVVIDISNRPVLCYRVVSKKRASGQFDVGLIREFFRALAANAGMTLHIDLLSGDDPHHISEAIFKAFARALDQATSLDSRLEGNVLSTKGLL